MKILLRLGADITIKSDKIRARFVGRLIQNLQSAFSAAGVQAKIERHWSRLYVVTDDTRALDQLTRVYGISSFSVIEHQSKGDLESVLATGLAGYKDIVAGKRFCVRSRRVGNHTYNSMEVMKLLGAALMPYSAGVDLHTPDVQVNVEIREDVASFYSRQTRGPGGLPLGVSGKVVCLLSGGFDSVVAAWYMQKRGLGMDFVFCNLAGGAYERAVVGIAKQFASEWSLGTRPRLHVLDFAPVAEQLRERVRASYVQVVLKRLFYRAAERIAKETGAEAILTGECVGQVSSQTLQNLIAIEAVAERPVLRPLIGFDKEEITSVARRIGTFNLSANIQEYCQLVPDKPVTAASAKRAAEEESGMDPAILDTAIATRKVILLADLSAADLVTPYLYTSAIPDDAVVVDCRPPDAYEHWHWPGATNLELHDLLARYKTLDKARTYVLYCPVGLQSAVAAEKMQASGYQAYSFKGGMKALTAAAPSAGAPPSM